MRPPEHLNDFAVPANELITSKAQDIAYADPCGAFFRRNTAGSAAIKAKIAPIHKM